LFLRIVERSFVIIFFLYLMGAATVIFYSSDSMETFNSAQGVLHWQTTVVQLMLFAIGLLLILTRWRRVAAAAFRAWPLLLLLGLQISSALWSVDPSLTLRKCSLEFLTLLMAFYFGERYTPEAFARILAEIMCMAMGLVAVLYVVAPGIVLDAEQSNALKGLAANKNGFGFYIGMTVALLIIVRLGKLEWLRYICLPVSVGMLLLSRSMTSVAAAAVILLSLPLWLTTRLPSKQRIAAHLSILLAIAAVVYLSIANSVFLFSLLGRDATFTGRTSIWQQLIVAIHHHPILGYGYGAFWTGIRGESLDVIVAAGFIVPSAHNAYLETWLGLGIPGLVLTALAFWKIFGLAVEYIANERGMSALWPIACIFFILVHGLAESEFIYDSSFACCMFSVLYTSLAVRQRSAHKSVLPERALASGVLLTDSRRGPLYSPRNTGLAPGRESSEVF